MLWRLTVWVRGLSSNRARSLPELQVATTWSVLFLQVHYALSNEVADYDVACQIGKAYNIRPLASWFLLKGMDAIMRSRPFFEFRLGAFGKSRCD